jgi:preprotein translocase subunit SecA
VGIDPPIEDWLGEDGIEPDTIEQRLADLADEHMAAKLASHDEGMWRQIEKGVLLDRLDHHWKEHLATLDALRQVVFLRAYAQKTPINEYKQEAFGLFENMLETIREDVTRILSTSEVRMPDVGEMSLPELPDFLTGHFDPVAAGYMAPQGELAELPRAAAGDDPYGDMGLSRNAVCPCGSGKKYKHCHGALV